MAGILQTVFRFLNRDVTGKTWERETTHPYFGPIIFFGDRDPGKSYLGQWLPLTKRGADEEGWIY